MSADRAGTVGTMKVNIKMAATPSPAANQNSACHSKCWAIAAASGKPSAPPTPSDELIMPMAEPTRSAGTLARSTLMPNGMIGMPNPCSPRPMITGSSESDRAAVNDPAVNASAQATSIGFGPYISPRRPNTGVATAAVSRVAVMAHDAFDGLVSSSLGSAGITGMISVCISETPIPARQRTAIRIPGCGGCAARIAFSVCRPTAWTIRS